MDLRKTQSDVTIVGAGPAGLACAIASARQGLRVDLIDAVEPPIDKACGEGLMPDSLQALTAIGVDFEKDLSRFETHCIHGIRFLAEHATSEATFPHGVGRGIRRTILHQILLERAASLGVRFHWKNSVQGITPITEGAFIHTNWQTFLTRFVVGADGPQSRVAVWAGLTQDNLRSRRIGLRQHYQIAPWSSFIEVYWGKHGQAYVTPISAEQICVAFLADQKIPSMQNALHHFPMLHRRLTDQPATAPRGAITLGRTRHRVISGNIALIGDASGSVDAITGEGIALGFRQAAALATALRTNDLASYQRAHRSIMRLPTIMSTSLLLMDRSPLLRNHALSFFQRKPWFFERLLGIHIGLAPSRIFESGGTLKPDYTC
ncbi:MAG TPA: NAD(P)/FAD-dependent oxidoreductase [Edaphobacter sp.]|jgi:flavin-dependent dehydrogenase|nr:NAD(P)/FAD-dependent oxidoreductase [Edaphobacter sp.]